MKSFKVLGPGCEKSSELIIKTIRAAEKLDLEYTLEKITNQDKIMEFGVIVTPALVIDDHVKFTGNIPSEEEIIEAIKQ
jgi:small redox-active disulfide protein 2